MSDDQQYTHSLPPGTELKDYRIERVLGKGGFGITYLAEDIHLKKRVAIKELLPDGIATRGSGNTVVAQTRVQEEDFRWAIDAFLKEAQTLAGFEHPNIVHIYRLFEANDTAYMVMPFVEGDSLKEMLKKRKTLPFEEVQNILGYLLDGLEVVHNANTLHRDIKPDNIIVTKEGTPILIDFGSARQTVSGKTQDVTSIITPGYAAIEQYSTDARYQGAWSDIYALAAVAYFMITGEQPVPASERNDAQRNMRPDPLPKLFSLGPTGFPSQFLHSIDTALQMSEQLRPQCIADWRTMLAEPMETAPAEPAPTAAIVTPEPTVAETPTPAKPPAMPEASTHTPLATTTTKPEPKAASSKKSNKKILIASICAGLVLLLGGGGIAAWKLFPGKDNGGSASSDISDKLTKIETYLDAEKPMEAKDLVDDIDRSLLTSSEVELYDKLSKKAQLQIENATNTVSVSIKPSFAIAELDGSKVKVENGKLEVRGLGKHTLRISADGYQTRSINFNCQEIGGRISLSDVELDAKKSTRSMTDLLASLEAAMKKGDFSEVAKLSGQLKVADTPKHLENTANNLLEKSQQYIDSLKWKVKIRTTPANALLSLNGKRVYSKNAMISATSAGKHELEVSAAGYEAKKMPFTMKADGSPHDLGTINLKKSAGGNDGSKIGITQATAIRIASSYVLAGNSPGTPAKKVALMADKAYFGDDQEKQKTNAEIEKILTGFYKRWGTRKYTIIGNPTVTPHSSGGSWVVSVIYNLELKDKIFTLKAKHEAKFAVMPIKGKPVIAAFKEFVTDGGKAVMTPDNDAVVADLKAFNNKRLGAADSDGGLTPEKEAAYYARKANYYSPDELTREQIIAAIKRHRARTNFRAYLVKSYSDFLHLNKSDPSGTSFSFKCVVEVTTGKGKSTRTETVHVKYINGLAYVTSVRY